ncbi:hypothetical protein EV385_4018 [Krasilnikovia cinnamomea]|uniref:Uncharacterized protein n=1 Tax=Krasilnikovia cinnamomea TaxID=349313 RepID=A0A4Q7ZND0_9ACTN|nr:hypothetical protein [Krasilnikovia cinnamomea]RZU52174.1 hypothetical protein EV385_4018 [Krasilnikovia cinnamomea]
MTSQPEPPGEARPDFARLRPVRDLAAYVLVGLPAIMLFVAVLRLVPSGVGEQFASRTQESFYNFVNLPVVLFPVGAVLLSLVGPRHPKARLITLVALAEYAAAAFFGVVFGVLVGLVKIAGFSVRIAFEELLLRVGWLAVLVIAAYAVWELWRHLFTAPKAAPGLYGQPSYGVPGTYPGQPGYGQPGPVQPISPQPTGPQPGAAEPGPAQPGPGASWNTPGGAGAQPWGSAPSSPAAPSTAVWGQPQGGSTPPTWGQPPAPPEPGTYGRPTVYGSPQPGAFAEPTQFVSQHRQDDDRTRVVGDERPGFGPAGDDLPRR